MYSLLILMGRMIYFKFLKKKILLKKLFSSEYLIDGEQKFITLQISVSFHI